MSPEAAPVSTRVASVQEIQSLLDWAADEGWNPGIDDASLFHATDPSGFFLSHVSDRLAAGISVVKHTPQQAFLGLYLCKPEFRGQGIGMATWKTALASFSGHCIGLDGVVDQQENYRKSGFAYHFGNTRYCGALNVTKVPGWRRLVKADIKIQAASYEDTDRLIEYDASIGGLTRNAFFNAWMSPCQTRYTFIATSDSQVVGMAGARTCIDGFKVGPLLADTEDIALQLLGTVSEVTCNEPVRLDVPNANAAGVRLAERLMLQPIFETARMYKGAAPMIDTDKLYGVATLELG